MCGVGVVEIGDKESARSIILVCLEGRKERFHLKDEVIFTCKSCHWEIPNAVWVERLRVGERIN